MDHRFTHLDTTRFSLTGHYVPESDEHAIVITHGDAKAHRPDLKPVVLALLVSQDGGGPWLSQSWDGNASDTQIVPERAQALRATLRASPSPRMAPIGSRPRGRQRRTLDVLFHLHDLAAAPAAAISSCTAKTSVIFRS